MTENKDNPNKDRKPHVFSTIGSQEGKKQKPTKYNELLGNYDD